MYAIDLGAPFGDDEDGSTLRNFPGAGPDLTGLNASSAEVSMLMDAIGEVTEEEWAAAVAELPDADADALADAALAELVERGYPDDMAPGTEFSSWMDSLSPEQYGAYRAESIEFGGGDELGYLRDIHRITRTQMTLEGREAARQREDKADRAARSAPHGQRPSDELILSSAVERFSRGSYVPGQLIDLAGDPWGDPAADELFSPPPASTVQVTDELAYQIRGGLAPARRYRQPLPPVSALAKTIGLRS